MKTNWLKMIFLKEIRYRKLNFILGLTGVTAAVALVVVFYTMTIASQNETKRLTRDMGFNLRIIPNETDMNNFWISGFSNQTMPENYVDILAGHKTISYAHLTSTLHKKVMLQGKEVILTGISPEELEPGGKEKSKMIFAIDPGKIFVGHEIAKSFQYKEGEKIDVLGKSFEIKKILSETGSEDDIRLYFDLSTLQKLTKMENRITEIMALNCLCSTEGDDPLDALRIELENVLPQTKVIMNRTIAVARERQRKMVDKYFAIVLPIMLILCAIWIGSLAMINVAQRRPEIGILRAIGFTTSKILGLFLIRVLIAGLIGAFLGFVLGTWLSIDFGTEIFKITASSIKPVYNLLFWSLLLAPLFAAVSAFIPIMYAIGQQPAQVLKED